jgi:hypothetical protein
MPFLFTYEYYDYIAVLVRLLLRHVCQERNLSLIAQALHCVNVQRRKKLRNMNISLRKKRKPEHARETNVLLACWQSV